MIAPRQETQQTVAQAMLQNIVEAICDRPGDTAAQRDARSRDVVHSVVGFRPRDPVEIMLAGMVVTHAHLVHDSARDALRGQEDMLKARTKSAIVALDRGMLGFLKELRVARTRRPETGDITEFQTGDIAEFNLDPAAASEAAPVAAPVQPKAEPVKQTTMPAAPSRPASRTKISEPEPPVPLLFPLWGAETSVAAMMAVLSPPNTPWPARPGVTMPARAAVNHTNPPASPIDADMAKPERAVSLAVAAANTEAAATFHAAVEHFAAVSGPKESARPRAAVAR